MFVREVLLLVLAVNHANMEFALLDTIAAAGPFAACPLSNVLTGRVRSSMLVTTSTGWVSSAGLASSIGLGLDWLHLFNRFGLLDRINLH